MYKNYISREYERTIKDNEINDDSGQREIIAVLEPLLQILNKRTLLCFKKTQFKGVYLFGPVGRGKTFLTEIFFKGLKTNKKQRVHFHQFIIEIDNKLRKLQGKPNPLAIIAKQYSKKVKVLIIDEFLIEDIAQALIITQLLPLLVENDIFIVITSNTKPSQLYALGLHRQRFIPTIEFIEKHFNILSLDGEKDYRLEGMEKIEAYIWPYNEVSEEKLLREFEFFSRDFKENVIISIQNRNLLCKKISNAAIWFDFNVICNIPRSEFDYLELAQKFRVFFISGIKPLDNSAHTAVLFIKLIDILYDKRIKLIMSASVPIENLYSKGALKQDFTRTLSRLQEMRTKKYLTLNCE